MKDLMLLGIGVWLLYELTKTKPDQSLVNNTMKETDTPMPTMGALYQYNPSGLKGALPYQPYGVRWGSGNRYLDTTKKAQLAI